MLYLIGKNNMYTLCIVFLVMTTCNQCFILITFITLAYVHTMLNATPATNKNAAGNFLLLQMDPLVSFK